MPKLIFSMLFLLPLLGYSQDEDADIATIIMMDSVVVRAAKTGFDVEEFIDIVRKDKSFYQAFRNLRYLSYEAENEMTFFDKKNQVAATYASLTKQYSDGKCRHMDFLKEEIEGNFYKKKKKRKKFRYYTAKMYDQVFLAHDTICENQPIDTELDDDDEAKGIRKHVNELKKLIFQPGEKVEVPLIGGKTAVFSEKLSQYYDYQIISDSYLGKFDCYVFKVDVKPEFEQKKEGKTIIKSMATYFEKETFQVVGRQYHLDYSGALFSFDIKMEIELGKIGEYYLPKFIAYDGFWNVVTKRKERGQFSCKIISVN